MRPDEVVRWEVKPLDRRRRGLDERVLLAAPWLGAAIARAVVRGPPGSALRRRLLTRATLVGIAANNRKDYRAMTVLMHPEVELHMLVDDPTRMGTDLDPVYRGRDGYVRALDRWKEPFAEFRWEVHELLDPGYRRVAARAEMVAVGRVSGIEIRQQSWNLWELEHGLVRRQWALATEEALLERL